MPSSSDPRPSDASALAATETGEETEVSDGMPRLSRLNVALLSLSIVSMCAALYLSPIASTAREEINDTVAGALGSEGGSADLTTPASPAARAARTAGRTGAGSTGVDQSATVRHGSYSVPSTGAGGVTTTSSGSAGVTSGAGRADGASGSGPGARHACGEFRWQQDAQRVYLANLSDPYGLDGDPGPYDGDGLACSAVPVDPSRPASRAVGAYRAPTPSAAAKAALVQPAQDYFGYSEDGLPGDAGLFTRLARQTGKAPSSVGWFADFDQPYRADLVSKSWAAGALPVVTLMPRGKDSTKSYSLTSIIAGEWDTWLTRYAGDVVRQNLPVSIRFAHEMNNNTYPWSAGMASYNNTPAKYVAAWRHVWQIFESVGANDDVIWLWSPSRVDNLRPSTTNGISAVADDYPGDGYVDWLGASVYLRHASTGASYAASFAKTVDQLEAVSDKPIFFAETAAIQSEGGEDHSTLKASWIENVLSAFAADDRVVGFLWFNNLATAEGVTNDWRITSSTASLEAFKKVIDTDAFASGVVPDS